VHLCRFQSGIQIGAGDLQSQPLFQKRQQGQDDHGTLRDFAGEAPLLFDCLFQQLVCFFLLVLRNEHLSQTGAGFGLLPDNVQIPLGWLLEIRNGIFEMFADEILAVVRAPLS